MTLREHRGSSLRRHALRCAWLVILICGAAQGARAELTVGLYAPAAQLPSIEARIKLVQQLAAHLQTELSPRQRIKSRVFTRASDFAAAKRDGKIDIALVDAIYLARASLGYRVVARGPDYRWQLVSAARTTAELTGQRLCIASGGRETEIVAGLFAGELTRGFFSRIISAPDSASALALLSLGKAEAALLPAGLPLSEGFAPLVTFPDMPGLVLVVDARTSEALRLQISAAALSFAGDGLLSGWRPAGDEVVTEVEQRLRVSERRGPMVLLPLRWLVAALMVAPAPQASLQLPPDHFLSTPTGPTSARPAAVRPTPPRLQPR
jgi:hypothetical protein